jgi:hypothetical protein
MPMAVMGVWSMWMIVDEWLVAMTMAVRCHRRIIWAVGVLMVFIVRMQMFVLHCLVLVYVCMALSKQNNNAHGHQ